ncbi:MAG: RNA methyltransferase [Bacteroidetes bacterium]|nr:RNA methyltransferase [Bacteroidota bacterium]
MTDLKEFKLGFDYIAKTFAGLEQVLLKELTELGADDAQVINRGVSFRGDQSVLFKANYLARTAIRVLKPIGVFEVGDDNQLYEKVRKINWEDIFNLDQTFKVNAHVFNSEMDHSQFVALRTKDAIVDQFRDKTGKRPWVAMDDADIYVDVHINENVCTISLDSSGESLHKRGYRIEADKAPINEVLAGGLIALTGWEGEKDFYDPMCGSGTIAIEAAMRAMKIPSGYYRKRFAFMNWEGFDVALWENIKKEADEKIGEIECDIYASDRSKKAVNIAKVNLKNAGLHKDINLSVAYFDAIRPEKTEGILVFNPPYGLRLEEKNEIIDLYSGIGDVLKQNFSGFEAWLITSNMEAIKFIGLRTSARIEIYNGPLESRFLKFELYRGSKKEKSDPDRKSAESEQENLGNDRSPDLKGDDEKRTYKRPENPRWKNADDKSSFRRKDEGTVKRSFKEKPEGGWKREDREKRPKFGERDERKSSTRTERTKPEKRYSERKDDEEATGIKSGREEKREFKRPFKRNSEGGRKRDDRENRTGSGERDERKPFKRTERPSREKREDDWKNDKGERGSKFGRSDDRKSFKKPERPKWKDKDNKGETREKDGDFFKKPQLGKPKKTEYTGDGKRGSRKKRPRLK